MDTPSRWTRLRRRVLQPLALMLPHGSRLLPTRATLTTLWHRSPRAPSRVLLVFLPGIRDLPGDFQNHGFAMSAWRAGFPADVVEADLHLGYYLRDTAVERLHEDVIRVARAKGYERIWLVGISLGGLGALLYARRHPENIDGVVVLGPFLGQENFIESLRLNKALPQELRRQEPLPQTVWSWLMSRSAKPPLYLGFGNGDRFAPAHRLLAELLPKGHVFSAQGGHDWHTWSRLWNTILSRVLVKQIAGE